MFTMSKPVPSSAEFAAMTPAEVDVMLAPIETEIGRTRSVLVRDRQAHEREEARRAPSERLLERLAGSIEKGESRLEELRQLAAPFHAEFVRRGGWTRAFLVVNGKSGHVHSSTACHTLFVTTPVNWLPEFSGSTEAEIIEAAGERAGTCCYPNAPAEVRKKPTSIFSEDEKKAAAARIERDKARAEKAAKAAAAAIVMPDGSPLRDRSNWVIKTERTATSEYVNAAAELIWAATPAGANTPARVITEMEEMNARILESIAAKHGQTVEDVKASLAKKVQAKYRRDWS